jgi:hypothetical protein
MSHKCSDLGELLVCVCRLRVKGEEMVAIKTRRKRDQKLKMRRCIMQ